MKISLIMTFIMLLWIAILLGLGSLLLRWLLYKGTEKYRRQREDAPSICRSLGETLKQERTRRGMTQEFVAEALGVSRQAVSKWENGTSDPSTSNLLALAKLYGVDVGELLKNVEI